MQVTQTGFAGLVIINLTAFGDERGFFLESFNQRSFNKAGVCANFVQDNFAYSREKGVLRGFHFQLPPATQSKLVWVNKGRVLDVVVDLRKGEPTFGKTFSLELDANSHTRLFVPCGFAHAYLTLEPDTEFLYKVDSYYAPEYDTGIRYNDPDIGFDWSAYLNGQKPILSEKDANLGSWAEFVTPFLASQE